jgi:hypothetical protein
MNEPEQRPLSAIDEARAMLRHPSTFGEQPSQVYEDVVRRRNAERLRTLGAYLHDFLRYGNPAVSEEFESYLHESGSGLHAVVVLDELEALIVGGSAPTPEAA